MAQRKKTRSIEKRIKIISALVLSASMFTTPVLGYSYEKEKILSSSTNSSSAVSVSSTDEVSEPDVIYQKNLGSILDRAVEAGYAQKVDKKESNEEVEFIVHNIVIEKNRLNANLSLKLLKNKDYSNMHPQIEVDFNEKAQVKRSNILSVLRSLLGLNSGMTTSYSMGYGINGEPNEDGYYEIALDSDLRDTTSGHIYFNLSKINVTKEIKSTHTAAEWLQNPEAGIEIISIENTNDEFFIKARSKENVNFSISQGDRTDIYSSGSSSSSNGDDNLQTITSYWKLDDIMLNLDEVEITSTCYQEMDGIPCDFSIDVPIDKDKIVQPFYNQDFNKTVSTIMGDITITNIQITPLTIYVTYAKNNELTPMVPEKYVLPNDLESYKERERLNELSYDSFHSIPELFKLEIDGERLWYASSSRNDNVTRDKTETTMGFSGSSAIGNISISVLQADRTYKEVSLND